MKKKILFYYPQHFNRSDRGTNPFFDPLLEVCEKHGISYESMEEQDCGTDKPRNPKAKKADTFFWTVTVIRKVVAFAYGAWRMVCDTWHVARSSSQDSHTNQDGSGNEMDFYKREKYVAKILNLLTFNKYKYKNYITISGSMFHLFSYLNPKGKVFDLQHGVLYKHHPTFFDEKNLKLRPQFYKSNLHFLFWGKGYEDVFIKGEEDILEGRTHVVGYPQTLEGKTSDLRKETLEGKTSDLKRIVVSLQFTHSVSMEERVQMKNLLLCFLDETKDIGTKVLLKHHPRFNNSIQIDDIFEKYDHVELTSLHLEQLAQEVFLHVTFYSTTAFEFASFGVPTLFLFDEYQPMGEILFKEEYHYPLYWGEDIGAIIERLKDQDNRAKDTKSVREWYDKFYSPFDERAFLEVLAGGT